MSNCGRAAKPATAALTGPCEFMRSREPIGFDFGGYRSVRGRRSAACFSSAPKSKRLMRGTKLIFSFFRGGSSRKGSRGIFTPLPTSLYRRGSGSSRRRGLSISTPQPTSLYRVRGPGSKEGGSGNPNSSTYEPLSRLSEAYDGTGRLFPTSPVGGGRCDLPADGR